jgi:uncharacterized membrane protein YeaQ/YmgE (transglycosylase-associated protein family)
VANSRRLCAGIHNATASDVSAGAYRPRCESTVTSAIHLQNEGKHMNLFIWLLVGGLLGWAASVLMGTNGRQGILLNVVVGIVGAFLGGLLLSGFFGTSTINEGNFSVNGLVVSFIGAVALLAVVRFFRLAR